MGKYIILRWVWKVNNDTVYWALSLSFLHRETYSIMSQIVYVPLSNGNIEGMLFSRNPRYHRAIKRGSLIEINVVQESIIYYVSQENGPNPDHEHGKTIILIIRDPNSSTFKVIWLECAHDSVYKISLDIQTIPLSYFSCNAR